MELCHGMLPTKRAQEMMPMVHLVQVTEHRALSRELKESTKKINTTDLKFSSGNLNLRMVDFVPASA